MKQNDIFALLASDKRPVRILQHYNQRETPYCIYYALAWCLAWNTWVTLTDEQVIKLGDQLKPWKLHARMPQIIKMFSPQFNCYTIRDDWSEVLNKGWWIQVYLRPTREFWLDALDGDIDNYQLPWDWLDHSVWIHKFEDKILMENSWAWIPTIDVTGKLDQLRKENVIPGAGYCFTQK